MFKQVLISAAALCAATVVGSLAGLAIKRLSHKWNDILLGYCAGVMLAAAFSGLILPASDMVSGAGSAWIVLGVLLGAATLNLLDKLTPHLHHITGLEKESHLHNARINKTLLFVLAIALHKLPEGMAAGVGFNAETSADAWTVSFAIALQNIPEGMVVISPLLLAGVNRFRSFAIALAIGLLEVAGVMFGFLAGGISEKLLPLMLSLAGGAMLFVVSDEMIPETHAHGFHKQATFALLLGIITMLLVEKAVNP